LAEKLGTGLQNLVDGSVTRTRLHIWYTLAMKSVVVCGSKRYNKEIKAFCKKLEKQGVCVFEPSIDQPIMEDVKIGSDYVTSKIFKGLTLEHFDWIRKSEACFIFNKGGYVGTSVTLEMGFANALGKPIFALEPTTGDPCRDVLIDKIVKTPSQLIKLL